MNHEPSLAEVTLQFQPARGEHDSTSPAVLFGVQGSVRGTYFALVQPRIRLGRSQENELPIPAPDISSLHCIIEEERGTFRIIDEGSRNGTLINGRRLAAHSPLQLAHGDKIALSSAAFLFLHPDALAAHGQLPEISVDLAAAQQEASGLLGEYQELVALRKSRSE